MRNNWVKAVAAGILFGTQVAVAAESGILLKADEMKAEPFRDSSLVETGWRDA